jgi:hypothetical protein
MFPVWAEEKAVVHIGMKLFGNPVGALIPPGLEAPRALVSLAPGPFEALSS